MAFEITNIEHLLVSHNTRKLNTKCLLFREILYLKREGGRIKIWRLFLAYDYSENVPLINAKCEEICLLFAFGIVFELLLDARGKLK